MPDVGRRACGANVSRSAGLARRRARAARATAGLALASLAVSGVASATPSARLVYSRARGAASCPDESALRRSVASRVGYDPFFGWARKTVVARMAPGTDGAGFVGSVNLIDDGGIEHGLREIRTAGVCAELLDPVALAIAIAIDPQLLAERPKNAASAPTTPAPTTLAPAALAPRPFAPPARPARPAPGASPVTVAATPPDPGDEDSEANPEDAATSPSPATSWEASVGLVASIGVAPLPAAGLSVGIGAERGGFLLDVEGRADLAATRVPAVGPTASDGASPGVAVSSRLLVATVAPCCILSPMRVCALGQAGQIHTASHATSEDAPWLAAGVRLATLVALGERTSLVVRSDVLGNLNRPTLALGRLSVWEAPPVFASFAADVLLRF